MKRLLLALLLLCALDAWAQDPLRTKIGQMIMVGFNGTAMDDTVRMDLAARNLGGVILMGRNCASPDQIRQLTTSIKLTAQTPPLIATDEEGGRVARLNQNNGYDTTVSNYTLGTVWNSLDSTVAQASIMASWLSDAGITTNLAPVVDVNVDSLSPAIGYYGRSFSANPLTVASHGATFINEFHNRQVMTCLKHFPGHGSAGTDSHMELPDITTTWADSELIPYRHLIDGGIADIVMVGHLFNATIDSVYPASLSRNTIGGLLRDSLHYQGVVISDAMEMGAVTNNYGFDEAAVMAVNAGVDILLYTSDVRDGISLCRHLVDTLASRVEDGTIPLARIDEAYARIQQLKARYLTTAIAERARAEAADTRGMSLGNYPNPFNPVTTIAYTVGEWRSGREGEGGIGELGNRGREGVSVQLTVYDILGRQVATLVNELQPPGSYRVRFDGTGLASGVYLYRLQSGSLAETQRFILLR